MDFHGGIILPLNHELTLDKPLVSLKLPGRVCILTSQHGGSPAVPCVTVGDAVKTFDTVARGMGAISCDVHAPISGTVEFIGEIPHPHYKYSEGIVIKSDGSDTMSRELAVSQKDSFTLEELTELARRTAIVDAGTGKYPLWYRLSGLAGKQIYYLIISFVQNEPYVHNIETIAQNFAEDVLHGIECIASALSPRLVFLAIPYHMKKLTAHLDGLLAGHKNFKIIRVSDKYPQGDETILAASIIKSRVKPGKLADAGCTVFDAATVFHLHEAARYGKPHIETHLTVSGYGITKPSNVRARVGTMISSIIEQCGGPCGSVNSIVMDGLMSGYSQYSTDTPVIKTSGALTLLPTERLSSPNEEPCMRCKKCIDHCPAFLNPSHLNRLSRSGDHPAAVDAGVYACIECGVCSYICPSRINITHSIILSKKMILQHNRREREANAGN